MVMMMKVLFLACLSLQMRNALSQTKGIRGGRGVDSDSDIERSLQSCNENPDCVPWIDLNESQDYTGRHECSFVQAGDRWYRFGGREEAHKLKDYDYGNDSWTLGAAPPFEFNHFQAIEFEGLVWVIGSFRTNNFPNEVVTEDVHVYNPANDMWMKGPEIPASHRRGGARWFASI